jgi:hypothetical protein
MYGSNGIFIHTIGGTLYQIAHELGHATQIIVSGGDDLGDYSEVPAIQIEWQVLRDSRRKSRKGNNRV